MYSSDAVDQTPPRTRPSVLLGTLSVHRVARVIRGLGSSLISIVCRQEHGKQMLIYTFDVAGEVQRFHLQAPTSPSNQSPICIRMLLATNRSSAGLDCGSNSQRRSERRHDPGGM